MVDLGLIKKRKAKKIVAIVGGSCLLVSVVICLAAILGQRAAPLTIELNNSGAKLALSESVKPESEKRSFLLAKETPGYTEFNGNAIPSYEKSVELDSELSEAILSSDKSSTLLYKYTFYVVNTGSEAADYTLSLDLSYPNRSASTFDLADVLRVRFYENENLDEHNYKTYAKATQTFDEATGTYIEGKEHTTDLDSPLVDENFLSNKVVLKSEVKAFEPESYMRYTFVFWLEGNDPDSEGKEAPVGSSLVLGVSISAHETETSSEEVPVEEE